MLHISEEDVQLLNELNNALGEIYTKGNDSIIIVTVRQRIFDILTRIQEINEEHAHNDGDIIVNLVGQQENEDIKEE